MKSEEIRRRFLEFFKRRGHAIVPGASLVPENDPSALFTTAGMQPLVPYLLGEPHPAGTRLVNIQKCVRTQDIEEVGDKTHDTFFEMLGNWSLGDYFKSEAIEWSYEFLTSHEEGLGLDTSRLYITVFGGNDAVPDIDRETAKIWESFGVSPSRIYFMEGDTNWWSPGENGPCGPDSEMFYDVTPDGLGDLTKDEFIRADKEQKVVEVWNDVFMEYEKRGGRVIGMLKNKNVDTGAGLERLSMVMQQKDNIFETDLFIPIMQAVEALAPAGDIRAKRIIADHIRTAVFIIGDGIIPSNTDRGYILRRLIRRAVRYADALRIHEGNLADIADVVIQKYGGIYENLVSGHGHIKTTIAEEASKFRMTLAKGLREFEKMSQSGISGKEAFILFSTYGFPFEVLRELAEEKGILIDEMAFASALAKHQEVSRAGAERKFKGGLAGHSEKEMQYHTATHLLNQALREVLGDDIMQKGSNITQERLRFDFSYPEKITDEQKKEVEDIVNEQIRRALPVTYEEMTIDEARRRGAIGIFDEKYGERVKVYQIGNEELGIFSLEFCGGPHVQNTSELIGTFKIIKEEAVAAGIRRIKAVLE
ncbi:MAG: alanine--tRNA ligase [Candidatus Lloydbacteria bacterium CG22_combo_CG10-13_8_21_14_all_47_15]|uniref:Alanine--tRNA ligase n=1 Tax=Candidatus Lloydbacteria bacterium CG22_combo_CG10-13_8_21_14_all_47_15 TaxID=1974635 RepID=A0A2H0CTM3_9BACT|nr:MAG: alanine--tRNA ligase [Candidatus Lloydbacteria bacterium CG22_combo_CG10-13_8_21_14_all_47_15]